MINRKAGKRFVIFIMTAGLILSAPAYTLSAQATTLGNDDAYYAEDIASGNPDGMRAEVLNGPDITYTSSGMQVRLRGLSPVAIAFKTNDYAKNFSYDAASGTLTVTGSGELLRDSAALYSRETRRLIISEGITSISLDEEFAAQV